MVHTRRPPLLMGTPLVVGIILVAATACSAGGNGGGVEAGAQTPAAEPATTTTEAPPGTASTAPATTGPAAVDPPADSSGATSPPVAPPAGMPVVPYATTVVGPAPTDPAELARMADDLVAAESALRDPATAAGDVAGLARRQQAAYRAIAARPEALAAVRERVPEALRPVVEANVTAGVELRALVGRPRTELPPWRIIPPPPADELLGYYREAESRYGVPWAYLASVHLVESRMGRIRGTSTAGAQGPMQFLPSTWAHYGEGGDINDPHDAIMAAARYLRASGAPDDMDRALFAYNRSHRYVRAVTLYARQMEAEPRAYPAYYHWQVHYVTTWGDVLLEEGYGS